MIETPKNKKYFKKAKYLLFACNEDAVLAMKKRARSLGYGAKIISLAHQGEAQELFAPLVKKIGKREILLLAGETMVKIRGRGKGGRNQEAVLAAVAKASVGQLKFRDTLISSFSSDSYDNTPVAGALADEKTLEILKKRKINPVKFLRNNDSYNFFRKVGGQIVAERRAFNVSDLMMVIRNGS